MTSIAAETTTFPQPDDAWKDALVARYAVADPAEARRPLDHIDDPAKAESIVAQYVPTFPAPVDAPVPAWADAESDWKWIPVDAIWARQVGLAVGDHTRIDAFQDAYADGTIATTCLEAAVSLDATDDPDALRTLAASLIRTADALDECRQAVATEGGGVGR
jgi:hypothetical protein